VTIANSSMCAARGTNVSLPRQDTISQSRNIKTVYFGSIQSGGQFEDSGGLSGGDNVLIDTVERVVRFPFFVAILIVIY